MIVRLVLSLSMFLGSVVEGSSAGKVTHRVQTTGIAVIEGDDLPAAAARARQRALRQAVEEGVGVLITSTTKVREYAVVEDRILSATKGYVRSYEILEEEVDDLGGFRVTIEAVVDLGELQDDLAALELAAFGAGLPRVLCIAEETLAGDVVNWGVVDSELHGLIAGMSDLLTVQVGEGDAGVDTSGADILVRAKAELILTQTPIPMSNRSVAETGLSTAEASLRLHIGWMDKSTPMGVLSTRGRGAGVSPRAAGERALRHAVALLSDTLRANMAEDLRQRAFSTRVVDLVVESDRASSDLDGLTRALESGLGPVQSLLSRGVDLGAARFEVRSTSSAFDLARQLSSKGIDAMAVEILQVTANSLRLSLQAPKMARKTPP